jgi:hypothetical protein
MQKRSYISNGYGVTKMGCSSKRPNTKFTNNGNLRIIFFYITNNSKTYLLTSDFHPNSNTVTSQGFYNKTISQTLWSKNVKKADVPVYAEGTKSSGIGRSFPKQEVTSLKFTNYIYLLALQTYYDRRDLVPKGKIIVADPGSFSRIPDHGSYSGSRIQGQNIPDPAGYGSASKNLSILTQKLFLSSRKYDPGCSSRIRVLILPIPDPGSRGARNSGSATLGKIAANKN